VLNVNILNVIILNAIMQNVLMQNVLMLNIDMQNVIILNGVVLNVIMLSVVTLSVTMLKVAKKTTVQLKKSYKHFGRRKPLEMRSLILAYNFAISGLNLYIGLELFLVSTQVPIL